MDKKEYILFCRKALLLVAPIFLICVFVEVKLNQIPNSYNKKRIYLENQLDSINVLILGSSQSLFGINPEFFSFKGFNLSNVSQSLFYDTELTLKYIDKMKNLKCIILSISYFSFWFQTHDSEPWRDYYYNYFWGIKNPELKWYDSKLYSLIMMYTPYTTLHYAKKLYNVDLAEELTMSGWQKSDSISDFSDINDKSGKDRVEYHERIRNVSSFNSIISILSRFIEECNKREIKVVFITMPVLPTYYKYTNPLIDRENTETIKKFCFTYNLNFYDYFRDTRFAIEDFKDNDHLNSSGAEKLSKILNDDFISKLGDKQ
jgi:hypothetical protein